jgi:hypothetical protein
MQSCTCSILTILYMTACCVLLYCCVLSSIGQTKPVTVIKLVAQGTVDEDIYRIGRQKQELNAAVLNEANGNGASSITGTVDANEGSTIARILNRAIRGYLKPSADSDSAAASAAASSADSDGGSSSSAK